MGEKRFSGRALTSLTLTGAFTIMCISGLVAYAMPHGRIAYWTDWTLLGLSKTQWTNIHVISALGSLVAAGFHIYFNWKPLTNYFAAKLRGSLRHGRELAVAAALCLVLCVSGIVPFPPLGWVFDFSATLKAAWVAGPEYEPPFGHAEELALGSLCRKLGIQPQEAMHALAAAGIAVDSPGRRFVDIARANGRSPVELFAVIQHLEPAPAAAPAPAEGGAKGYTAQDVEGAFAGTGIGRKTLAQIAAAAGQSPQAIQARLAAQGLAVGPDEALKQAATRLGISPLELLKAMLVDGHRPQGM